MANEVKHLIFNNASETTGEKLTDHFADIGKMVDHREGNMNSRKLTMRIIL